MVVTAFRSSGFVSSIGVNTHLNDILGPYGDLGLVTSELTYLGLGAIRDTNAYSWTIVTYTALAKAGFKLDIIAPHDPGEELGNGGLARDLSSIHQIVAAVPGSVIGIEGQNEPHNFPDTWNGQPITNWQVVNDVQQVTYAAIRSDPVLAAIPVLNTSVETWSMTGRAPDMSQNADFGSAHVYPYSGNQPLDWLTSVLADQRLLLPAKRDWVTEFGYSSTPGDASYGSTPQPKQRTPSTGFSTLLRSVCRGRFSTSSWMKLRRSRPTRPGARLACSTPMDRLSRSR